MADKPIISFQNAVILAALIVLGHIAMIILLRDNLQLRVDLTDIVPPILNGIASASLLYASLRSQRYGYRVKNAWFILAVAQLSFAIGDTAWMIQEVFLKNPTYPAISDIFYLAYYPMFLVGILLLPSEPLTPGERFKTLLDIGVVMIGSSLIFWALLIAPALITSGNDIFAEAIAVAYPIGDLMILFALMVLLFRSLRSPRQGPLLILAGGTLALIATDTVYSSQSMSGTYVSGDILDSGWIIYLVLAILAGLLQADSLPEGSLWRRFDTSYVRFKWPSYLPYFCVVATYILLIWSQYDQLPISFSTMAWGVGGIIGLVIARQIIALNENASLYSSTLNEVAERRQAEEAVKKLNEELEERVESRTVELKSTNDDLKKEILERRRAEEELHKRDILLSGVAVASNLLLTLQDIEQGLNQALEIMGLAADIDIASIFENKRATDGGLFIGQRFEWVREGFSSSSNSASFENTSFIAVLPQWYSILASGMPIKGLVKDFPESEQMVLRRQGILSFMMVPIIIEDLFWGVVSFGDCHSEHQWSEWEISILLTFAGSIGGAVARNKAESILKGSLREKEVLLKEVHHRVKNNMQVISSLLNIQAKYIEDKHASEMFMESRSRIRSMALVHETLYRSNDLARIEFADYLLNLIRHLRGIYGSSRNVKFITDIDPISLDIEKAVPCGLILNELITNSIKYAFPKSGKDDTVYIELHSQCDQRVELIVRDNGVGLPDGLDLQKTKSMGLTLVSALVKQLRGAVEINRCGGTEFKILFGLTIGANA